MFQQYVSEYHLVISFVLHVWNLVSIPSILLLKNLLLYNHLGKPKRNYDYDDFQSLIILLSFFYWQLSHKVLCPLRFPKITFRISKESTNHSIPLSFFVHLVDSRHLQMLYLKFS